MSPDLLVFALSAVRALAEFLMLCLLARLALGWLAGQRRESNLIYQLFDLLTSPPRKLMLRLLGPSFREATITKITFLILFGLWIVTAYLRQRV